MSAIPSSPTCKASSVRHTCHCGKSFLRKEHLRRHEANHDRPSFVCHICGHSFCRNDILRKHISVHDTAHVPMPKGRMACDACHRNKIKCDGDGGRCLSCVKRRILCTFDRAQSTNQVDDGRLDSALQKAYTNNERQVALAGLQYTMGCISAAMAGDPVKLTTSATPEHIKAWQKLRTRAFFAGFHERWPVVHAPTLDTESDNPLLVGTVMIISTWNEDNPNMKETILSIHKRLLTYLQQQILSANETPDQDKAWPFELYTTALLNIIFAFETATTILISQARHLLALLVGTFREQRIFSAQAVEAHETKHHPGSFRPWHYQHRDKWKWLVLCLVKVDVYMALLCNQPPTILTNELELGLTTTFSLSNAHGIDKFVDREQEDPIDRQVCTMAAMVRGSGTVLASGTLIEDVWLGLCGTFAKIWSCNQLQQIQSVVDAEQYTRRQESVLNYLQMWKIRLQGIADLATEPVRNSDTERLLRAYRGEEEVITPGWEDVVQSRISTYVVNANLFYHLLGLHCTADIKSITAMALSWWSITGYPAAKPDSRVNVQVGQWIMKPAARIAVLHALHILKIYTGLSVVPQSMDPIGLVALSTAGMVFQSWIQSGRLVCRCREGQPTNLDMDVISAENEWVRDGGAVVVDAMPLCVCSSSTWIARFAGVLAQRGKGWGVTDSLVQQWLAN